MGPQDESRTHATVFMLIKVEAGDSVGWNSERPSV